MALTSHRLRFNKISGRYDLQEIETEAIGDNSNPGIQSVVKREFNNLERSAVRKLMKHMGIEQGEFDVADMALQSGEEEIANFGWFGGFMFTTKES